MSCKFTKWVHLSNFNIEGDYTDTSTNIRHNDTSYFIGKHMASYLASYCQHGLGIKHL